MFFFLSLLSMAGYAFQSTLLAHHARRMDGLSLAFYRNLSLCFSMVPLLFLVPHDSFSDIPGALPNMILAAVCGTIGLAFGLQTVQYMAVGISMGIKASILTITALLLGYFFFSESITLIQGFFILGILFFTTLLALQKNHFPHLTTNTLKGLLFCSFSGVFTALSGFFMSQTARDLNPFLSGYAWEFGIFLCSFFLILGRFLFTKQRLSPIPSKEFFKIMAISSTTLIGTGCLAYAVTLGPFGVVSAIGSSGILLSTLLAFFLYQEKLKKAQWILITLLLFSIVGLKLTGL